MRIAHWAPFAPHRCGLYEAARDMARADEMRGHEVLFIDTGVTAIPGKRDPCIIGGIDDRGGWKLTTSSPLQALEADLWVCHDGVADNWSARCQAPMIWMIHGRPLACFRPEQENVPGNPYSIIAELATWPRVKALVTMWREHEDHWSLIVPPEKLYSTENPPIDTERFSPDGARRLLDPRRQGEINLLICDSWRPDIDIYEIAVLSYHIACEMPGRVKVHFWGVEPDKQVPWQRLWKALDMIGALGETHARETGMADTYRSMDALLTPHVICTRTVGEALACGIPVIAPRGNRFAACTGGFEDMKSFAQDAVDFLTTIHSREQWSEMAKREFGLEAFGKRMEPIYEAALDRRPAWVG